MKLKLSTALTLASTLLTGILTFAVPAHAQTVAYRQTNLASDVSTRGFANHLNPSLRNTWGVASLPGQPFFVTNPSNGRVVVLDAGGNPAAPLGFLVPGEVETNPAVPTAIVADPDSFFGSASRIQPFLIASRDGAVYIWAPDSNGNLPAAASLVVNHSQSGAVYTGLAILAPDCCAPFLAVANFHAGVIETYTRSFAPLAAPGSFTDPNLPAGYAPYGMQVVGRQLFVTYAVQDPAQQEPLFGAGNGIVSVFDLEGNFVRRFATAGSLNAPWGVARASANFGPFSNDILVANTGDGTISAFDPVTGDFARELQDGDGNLLAIHGLHALAFRSDGFGDPNTLYFTAGINDGQNGLFGTITTGLVSTTRASFSSAQPDSLPAIMVAVSAAPGNTGIPTGFVAIQDGDAPVAVTDLIDGVASLSTILTGAGTHRILARYGGDGTFLRSSSEIQVEIAGAATQVALAAPANTTPGASITLTATVTSTEGVPTGQVVFLEGDSKVGAATLDVSGVAVLRVDTLLAGMHSIRAFYTGDDKFQASASAPATVNVSTPDFTFAAAPASASVPAGQSAQFVLTVTPSAGFAGNVAFSCSPSAGIACSFNPSTLTPAGAPSSTTLTVTTSASVARFGLLPFRWTACTSSFAGLMMLIFLFWRGRNLPSADRRVFAAAALLVAISLSFALEGCGGYSNNPPSNRGTASVVVTAQSGALSHSTTLTITVQ